tara:strand:- start:1055 stop:1507 length:453 start_codon:yes stop_codon:yes gene_type:complete
MAMKKKAIAKLDKLPGQTGRKLLDIDETEVQRMAEDGCNDTEIADFFGCADTTISRRFAEILRKSRVKVKKSLRRKQIELALDGDKTMLIWLGKQMLGQRDSPAVAIQNNITSNDSAAAIADATPEQDRLFCERMLKIEEDLTKSHPDTK